MKKVKIFMVDQNAQSELVMVLGFDKIKKRIVIFERTNYNLRPLLKHHFTGKNGMFSAKDAERFIKELPEALSYNTYIWAKSA